MKKRIIIFSVTILCLILAFGVVKGIFMTPETNTEISVTTTESQSAAPTTVLSMVETTTQTTTVTTSESRITSQIATESTTYPTTTATTTVPVTTTHQETQSVVSQTTTEFTTTETTTKPTTTKPTTIKPTTTKATTAKPTTTKPTITKPTTTKLTTIIKPTTTKPTTTESTTKKQGEICYITITCTTINNNLNKLDSAKKSFVPSSGVILKRVPVELQKNDTVFSVLRRACAENTCTDNCKYCQNGGVQLEYTYTPAFETYYIEGIHQLYEKDCGTKSGWMYSVNGNFPNVGSSSYSVNEGDEIVFAFTCDMGEDIGNPY